jgi:hypothetical protein
LNPIRLLLILSTVGLVAGCGTSPTGPPGDAPGGPSAVRIAAVPDFSDISVRYADGLLHVSAAVSGPGAVAPFDPSRAGGWCFQLFIDTDQAPSGYGAGIDYLVRAIEIAPGGGVDVRRAEGGGGPGGWGEAVGRVAMTARDGRIECTVPLAMLGPDDGAIDFVLETYRTVLLPPSKGGTVKHEFVANYAGVSVPFSRIASPVRRGFVPVAPLAQRLP